jgi:hypothetical protein
LKTGNQVYWLILVNFLLLDPDRSAKSMRIRIHNTTLNKLLHSSAETGPRFANQIWILHSNGLQLGGLKSGTLLSKLRFERAVDSPLFFEGRNGTLFRFESGCVPDSIGSKLPRIKEKLRDVMCFESLNVLPELKSRA